MKMFLKILKKLMDYTIAGLIIVGVGVGLVFLLALQVLPYVLIIFLIKYLLF